MTDGSVDHISLGEVYRLLQRVDEKVDLINNRVQKHGAWLARHDERIGAVRIEARRTGTGWGSLAGGFVGGIIGALYQWFGGSK